MKITWVTRSFLDYRLPVFAELNKLCNNQLTVIFNREVVPPELTRKITSILSERAVGMVHELRLGGKRIENAAMANSGIRIPLQPGLLRKIKKSLPDVMISDGFMQWTYAPLWIQWQRKIPHVMCYERTSHTERNCQWYRSLYRKVALHRINMVCANGILCGDYLRQLGCPEAKIAYGHMAADTEGIAEAIRHIPESTSMQFLKEFPGKMVFLYVGQIISRKGIRPLLEAWEMAALKNAILLLVGDGEESRELQEWTGIQKQKNIYWLGRKPYAAIAEYYHCADVFIMPTLEDNWSLVVPEAMACGLPIACSIYNGCHPELVKPENGWLFDPLNCEATANILKQINREQERFPAMGEASRRIVADFSPAHAARNIYHTCEQAIKHQRQRELATI